MISFTVIILIICVISSKKNTNAFPASNYLGHLSSSVSTSKKVGHLRSSSVSTSKKVTTITFFSPRNNNSESDLNIDYSIYRGDLDGSSDTDLDSDKKIATESEDSVTINYSDDLFIKHLSEERKNLDKLNESTWNQFYSEASTTGANGSDTTNSNDSLNHFQNASDHVDYFTYRSKPNTRSSTIKSNDSMKERISAMISLPPHISPVQETTNSLNTKKNGELDFLTYHSKSIRPHGDVRAIINDLVTTMISAPDIEDHIKGTSIQLDNDFNDYLTYSIDLTYNRNGKNIKNDSSPESVSSNYSSNEHSKGLDNFMERSSKASETSLPYFARIQKDFDTYSKSIKVNRGSDKYIDSLRNNYSYIDEWDDNDMNLKQTMTDEIIKGPEEFLFMAYLNYGLSEIKNSKKVSKKEMSDTTSLPDSDRSNNEAISAHTSSDVQIGVGDQDTTFIKSMKKNYSYENGSSDKIIMTHLNNKLRHLNQMNKASNEDNSITSSLSEINANSDSSNKVKSTMTSTLSETPVNDTDTAFINSVKNNMKNKDSEEKTPLSDSIVSTPYFLNEKKSSSDKIFMTYLNKKMSRVKTFSPPPIENNSAESLVSNIHVTTDTSDKVTSTMTFTLSQPTVDVTDSSSIKVVENRYASNLKNLYTEDKTLLPKSNVSTGVYDKKIGSSDKIFMSHLNNKMSNVNQKSKSSKIRNSFKSSSLDNIITADVSDKVTSTMSSDSSTHSFSDTGLDEKISSTVTSSSSESSVDIDVLNDNFTYLGTFNGSSRAESTEMTFLPETSLQFNGSDKKFVDTLRKNFLYTPEKKADSTFDSINIKTTPGGSMVMMSTYTMASTLAKAILTKCNPMSTKELFDTLQSVTIHGGALKTCAFTEQIDRVSVLLKTDGRPLNAKVELWHGPNNAPQTMNIYIEDGSLRQFRAIVECPEISQVVAVRNTGEVEFPMVAALKTDNSGPVQTIVSNKNPRIVQGGAVYTTPFDSSVQSVQVSLNTDGRPLYAKIEILQGPDHGKQVMDVYTEDGLKRPFNVIIDTPGSGNVIRIVNTATIEYPLTASVSPYATDIFSDTDDTDPGLVWS